MQRHEYTASKGVWIKTKKSKAYPSCSNVLMLNPRVGEMVVISSPLMRFRMVVLPALSRPLVEESS